MTALVSKVGQQGPDPALIEAVFKPARNNGGLTTVSIQVGGYGTALLGSIRRRQRLKATSAL